MQKIQDDNLLKLTGTLLYNPQVGFWKDIKMTKFSLLVRNDEKRRQDIIEIACFGKWANMSGRVLRRGDKVSISGRLKTLRCYNKMIENNTCVIANRVFTLNLSIEIRSARYKKWHYFDKMESRKMYDSLITTGVDIIPNPIKRLFFFSKTLQAEIYWRYWCFLDKRRQRKRAKSNK